MNTPNKYAYASTPKGKDVSAMYPSQSSDYISFHMGGQSHATNAQKWRNEPRSSRGSHRGHYNNFNNRNNRDVQQPQHHQQQNVPYFYQDRTPNDQHNNQQQNRPNRRFNFQRINMQHGVNKDMVDIMDYVHSSMLEDPWQSLVERHETIEACDLQLHVAENSEEKEEEQQQETNDVSSKQAKKEE